MSYPHSIRTCPRQNSRSKDGRTRKSERWTRNRRRKITREVDSVISAPALFVHPQHTLAVRCGMFHVLSVVVALRGRKNVGITPYCSVDCLEFWFTVRVVVQYTAVCRIWYGAQPAMTNTLVMALFYSATLGFLKLISMACPTVSIRVIMCDKTERLPGVRHGRGDRL